MPDEQIALRSKERRQTLIGVALIIGTVACFAALDASAKWVNQTTDPLQTASVRYLGSFLLVSLFLNPFSRRGILKTQSLKLQCGRALCLTIATFCNFAALRYLPLTEATSINFASPLIVTLIAGPLLGEWIGIRQIGAVVVGFIGVLVITRPGGEGIHPAALLSLITAGSNALYVVTTRLLTARDTPETTMFYTGFVGSILALPILFFVWTTPTDPRVWAAMAATVVFGSLGHWLLILAHRFAPASTLAPFFYVQLVWVALVGFMIFGEVPDGWTLIGGTIVIASGLYLLYQGRVKPTDPAANGDAAKPNETRLGTRRE